MRILRNDAFVGASVLNRRVLLLFFKPFQHAGKLLTACPGHFELQAKLIVRGIGNLALQLAKVAEVRVDAIADLADDRDADEHSERRHPARPASELAELALRVVSICK